MFKKRNKFFIDDLDGYYCVTICGENITNKIDTYMSNMSEYGGPDERNMEEDMCHWHWSVKDHIGYVRKFLTDIGLKETDNLDECW